MFSRIGVRTSRVGRKAAQLSFGALTAATLAACAQFPAETKSPSLADTRPPSPSSDRTAALVMQKRPAVAMRNHAPLATAKPGGEVDNALSGIASFYTEGTQTANGEKFDTYELTAAHRTLPFGTRVRVTNVATGRSVTVRINDRGPFVPGRVIDVSYVAAETLGITQQGIAKVTLDVAR